MTTRRDSSGRRTRRAAVCLALFLAPRVAAAEPGEPSPHPVRLVWTRAPEADACPEASVVEADVSARLGENPFRSDATGSIDVRVTRERGEWRALIEERPDGGEPAGSRVVTSAAESCDSLALAVGLAVALMIRARTASEPAPAPKPAPLAPLPAPPAPVPTPDCDEPSAAERHVAAFVNAALAVGVLPRPAFGVSVAGRVPVAEHASLRASLVFLPEQRTRTASGEFRFGATFGELGGCYDTSPVARFRFAACAAALLGSVHVVVVDPVPLEQGGRFWGAGALGLRADFSPANPLHLVAGVDGAIPFVRHSYVVERGETTETVFTEPRFAALFSAGIGVEL